MNLVTVRKFQSDIREALIFLNNDKETKLKTKEWKRTKRNQLFNKIYEIFARSDYSSFVNDIDNYIQNIRKKTKDNRTINTLNSI